jgi:hypothetical protein
MRKVALLRTSPTLYRLALAWGAVPREALPLAPDGSGDPWRAVVFDFQELAHLADVSPRETLAGFIRLKAHGIINPDGTVADNVEKFFKAEGLAGFGIKAKPPKEK